MKKVIVAVIAIVALTGGTATASSIITGAKVRDSSLTGRDVKNKSLTAADFRGSVRGAPGLAGPAGAAGPAGPQGAPGAQGAPGLANVTVVDSARVGMAPGDVVAARADCPAGTRVIGTGHFASVADTGFVLSYTTHVGGAFYNLTSVYVEAWVQATCASVSGGAGPRTRSSASRTSFAEDVARFKATK